MSDRYGLSEKTIDAIKGVFVRYAAVEQAILFGSRAKGNYKPGSDIDLVLRGSSLNQRTLNRIYTELDDLPIPYGLSLVLSDKITDPKWKLISVGLASSSTNAMRLRSARWKTARTSRARNLEK